MDPPARGGKRELKPPSKKELAAAKRLEAALFGGAESFLDDEEAPAEAGLSMAALVRREARSVLTGPGAAPGARKGARAAAAAQEEEEPKPVWEDEDDAQLRVPIAGKSRLRKLRVAEGEVDVDGSEYERRLRKQHAAMHPRTQWAALPRRGDKQGEEAEEEGEDEEEEAEEEGRPHARRRTGLTTLLSSAAGLTRSAAADASLAGGAGRGLPLPPRELQAVRVADANAAAPAASVLRSVAFHHRQPLLLAAGLDKTLRLFSIDGGRNAQAAGVHFEDLPIQRAAFGGDGDSVVLTGRRPFFYIYHMGAGKAERISQLAGCEQDRSWESFAESPACAGVAGRQPLLAFLCDGGRVPLVSLSSRTAITTLQMSGTARCASFSGDGVQLRTAGGDGVVYLWDLRQTARCLERSVDAGSAGLGVHCLATQPNGRFWAAGGSQGVVNLYSSREEETAKLLSGSAARGGGPRAPAAPSGPLRPQPLKALMNLTTSVDLLQFSPDGQMLAMGSRMKKDGLRVVHLPSATVFQNWPSSKTPLNFVHCAAFSPHCGYMAIGNARGRVLLYRLPHYDQI